MDIPKEQLNEWKVLAERGDIEKIHKVSGLSRYKLSLAINYGRCNEETYSVLSGFYAKRQKKQEKINQDAVPY